MKNHQPISTTIDEIMVGKVAPFGPSGEPSAINKLPVSGPVKLEKLGFSGDNQADKRFHGGVHKAVHHFPAEHYDSLKALFPDFPSTIGGFGENISTRGIVEKDLCLGDIFSVGSVLIQVSQGRQPCWKLNVRFHNPKMAKLIQENGWTGWYYRVLTEGEIMVGDQLTLIERPHPDANLARIQHYQHRETMNLEAIEKLLKLEPLPPRLRSTFENRLKTKLKESDSARIETPTHSKGLD